MENIGKVLLENYKYVVIVMVFFILAIIGYIIDTVKTDKLKKKYENANSNESSIPIIEEQVDDKHEKIETFPTLDSIDTENKEKK